VFRNFLDKDFVTHYFEVSTLNGDTYGLFIDGLETGIIGAVLVISQIMFLIMRVRLHYQKFTVNTGGTWPNA
jgi:hypothetical protein